MRPDQQTASSCVNNPPLRRHFRDPIGIGCRETGPNSEPRLLSLYETDIFAWAPHGRVHGWYRGTIDDNDAEDYPALPGRNWYPGSEATEHGFALLRGKVVISSARHSHPTAVLVRRHGAAEDAR